LHRTTNDKGRESGPCHCLFPPCVVAAPCRIPHTAAGLRLAWRKNSSVSFVPLFPVRNTRSGFSRDAPQGAKSKFSPGSCRATFAGYRLQGWPTPIKTVKANKKRRDRGVFYCTALTR
jgi:hypothetical protein